MISLLVALLALAPAPAQGARPMNAPAQSTTVVSLDGEGWVLATDPQNVGRDQAWYSAPPPEAKPTRVPWTIQSVFPGYSGVAWYWRDVEAPANPHKGGRYLLRFWDVDYLADVWVNGKHVGTHEGAQARFTLDVTSAVTPGAANRIAVRVVSPFVAPVDGLVRSQTPHGAYRDLNVGGILDSVELLVVPQVRIEDLYVRADPKTGVVRVEATVRSEARRPVRAGLQLAVSPANGSEPAATCRVDVEVVPGSSTLRAELRVAHPRLWQLNDPQLYRVTARIGVARSSSIDEAATRFGFRDFRFEKGCFRLNGRRIFWVSAHTGADTPVTIRVPCDPGLLRQDLVNLKAAGFTGVRFISIVGQRCQLDLCDEIGLMVYEESHASWMLSDSPKLAERMDASISGMILRDRNHPSVAMWGLLNETGAGPVFDHALQSLPLVRKLDDTRVVMLGSGRFESLAVLNGLEVRRPADARAPCASHNPKPYSISGITLWRPSEVALIPGVNGEYGVARWTAPVDGQYRVTARFRGTGHFTVSDVHVLHAGKPLYDGCINQQGRGDDCAWAGAVTLKKGEALDFVVGGRTPAGGEWYERWGNNTSVAATVTLPDGTRHDLADGFSATRDPAGPWTYGWLAPGPAPDAATFRPFDKSEVLKNGAPGSLSNPGSDHWEDVVIDQHYYPRVPHRELEIARLRGIAGNDNPIFLSEYGVGSAVDLPRFIRHHEQLGVESGERLDLVKGEYAAFLADWARLKLDEAFASPEDFFTQCVAREAALKAMGLNALRSNPNLVAYGMTGLQDPLEFGEGFTTAFRELKPGTTDAIFEGLAPVKWCTFAEPVSVYRGAKVRLEAVLSNIDAAPPGQYPARVQVIGPDNRRVLDRTITVTVPGPVGGKEPSFATPVLREEAPIDGPTGRYRFLVTFQRGVAATGGDAVFYVTDPADMPEAPGEVSRWGDDAELGAWLAAHGIRTRPYQPGSAIGREVILVSHAPAAGGTDAAWKDLADRVAAGATAVFLCPDVFRTDADPLGRLPLAQRGRLDRVSEYWFPQVYPKDEWARKHPLFDGLPSGGLMDYTFYREIIPDFRFLGQSTPDEAVAGSFRTSHPGAYWCDTMLSVHKLGQGRFILNSLRVRQELGRDPTAERLLRNMLRYAAKP